MRGWGVMLSMLAGAMPAGAQIPVGTADKPAVGPIPAWVRAQTPIAPGKSDGGAARVLLQDQQTRFERGVNTTFAESVFEIETAQGLPAGNIAFAWNPQTDTPVIHRLQIRRGDKVIDVLASQSFTVLRREQNLENAMLDGVLTATLQPEGLQVGDVIDFAFSIRSHDPVLGEHVERLGGGWNGLAVGRAHLRAEWPAGLPVALRQPEGLPPIHQSRQGDMVVAELTVDDLPVLPPPNGAPARFLRARVVEMSDYRDWAALGATMAPLYANAGTLPASGPLHDEWAKLDAAAATPKAKTQAMLAFVQDRVRYVALLMGAGGYVPADAATTWERRFGDCKAKTALLLALLHASGIDAVPVAVNGTGGGDGVDAGLPVVGLFNHVLVRATIAGRAYWLDGTRQGDTDIDRLRVPNVGWGLPLVPQHAALVRMVPAPLDRPNDERLVTIDASDGLSLPARFRVELTLRDDPALGTDLSLRNLPPDQRDRALRDYWRQQYNFVEPEKVEAHFDPATGEERVTMSGPANMVWKDGWYETDGTSLGWQADFHREPGIGKDAPFATAYPVYSRVKEVIKLPSTFHGQIDGSTDVDQTVGGVAYYRKTVIENGALLVEASQRSLQPEFPAADAPAAQAALRKMSGNNVFLRWPGDYQKTTKEMEASLKTPPKTAAEFSERGTALLVLNRPAEAAAAFDGALALAPGDTHALMGRAYAYTDVGKRDLAEKDLAAVRLREPHNGEMLRIEMMLAARANEWATALSWVNQALAIAPKNARMLAARSDIYAHQANIPAALADADAAIALDPHLVAVQLARFNMLRAVGRSGDLRPAVAAMLAANPDDGYAHVIAGNTYRSLNDSAAALRELDRAIAIKPEAYIYLNRAYARPVADKTAIRADLYAALALAPADVDAVVALVQLEEDEGKDAAALKRLAPALSEHPHLPRLLSLQAVALLRTGQAARATQIFAEARTKAGDAQTLNTLCYDKATHNVALAEALKDCDAAIAKSLDAGILDSRAFVQLRLGNLPAALADYDAALAKAPKLAASLYGRAIVHARRGEAALAAADEKAALAIAPEVARGFADYGVTLPAATTVASKAS